MNKGKLYLLLAVPGFIVPWLFLAGFLAQGEVTVSLFFLSIFANQVSGAVAADLLISAFIFFLFVYLEGRRLGMQRLWIYPVLTLGVGLSFGMPLFLYFRERRMAGE
jgi:hypothetical protein